MEEKIVKTLVFFVNLFHTKQERSLILESTKYIENFFREWGEVKERRTLKCDVTGEYGWSKNIGLYFGKVSLMNKDSLILVSRLLLTFPPS